MTTGSKSEFEAWWTTQGLEACHKDSPRALALAAFGTGKLAALVEEEIPDGAEAGFVDWANRELFYPSVMAKCLAAYRAGRQDPGRVTSFGQGLLGLSDDMTSLGEGFLAKCKEVDAKAALLAKIGTSVEEPAEPARVVGTEVERDPEDWGWEGLYYDEECGDVARMRVPGGWLFRSTQWVRKDGRTPKQCTESMVFVPDPN